MFLKSSLSFVLLLECRNGVCAPQVSEQLRYSRSSHCWKRAQETYTVPFYGGSQMIAPRHHFYTAPHPTPKNAHIHIHTPTSGPSRLESGCTALSPFWPCSFPGHSKTAFLCQTHRPLSPHSPTPPRGEVSCFSVSCIIGYSFTNSKPILESFILESAFHLQRRHSLVSQQHSCTCVNVGAVLMQSASLILVLSNASSGPT